MIRTIVIYDGIEYTISKEGPDAVRERIRTALASDGLMWLEVNRGDGRPTPALLLVSRSSTIALVADRDASDDGDPVRYRLEEDEHLLGTVDDVGSGHVEGMTGIEPA
ncbi:hypothetical protein DEI93_04040 [Curtobacterium sp. MCBD17_035]|uniref:hypothetical protein n=1 Tax=Curtobacterium sp. MCBD17_035 TaxID=2175673 RepID=UPI000DAA1110|nr:hypothetical protein [Curtobacterium sp. MCBD17_035]WIB68223.1 hypothetical protein DEI93_04040 [Curtobacterium sp. MCBD17_035]